MAEHRRRGEARSGTRAIRLPGLRLSLDTYHASSWLSHRWSHLKGLAAREVEHRTPFLWLPVAFGLGILAYFSMPQEPLWWHGPLLALLMLVPAITEAGLRRVLGITLLFAALGFSAATWRSERVKTPMIPREMTTEVRGFVETLDPGQGRLRLTIRPVAIGDVAPASLPRAVRIGAAATSEVSPGEFVVLRARLSPPSEASMPGGYDFRRDAFFKGIGGVGYALGRPVVEAPPRRAPLDLRFNAYVDQGRNWLSERIARAVGGQAGALSAALITGKRGLISETTNDDLRASGLYHIVSISGLHMVLAAGVLFWAARALLAALPGVALVWPIKKMAALVAMAGATFYCVFSGSEVATERSLIMTLVILGAILADRPALAMRNLAISALLVLAREPESLMGPSFQMSFAAVACLIGANRVWQGWRRAHVPRDWGMAGNLLRRAALVFLGILATTLVASIATGPFSVFHFHRVNPFSLIGNALALPLVSVVVMPAAVIGTFLSLFSLDGMVWRIMGEGVAGVLYVAEQVGRLENASFAVARLSLTSFGLMVLALLLFVNLQSKLRALCLVPLALMLFVPVQAQIPDIVVDPFGKSALVRGEDGQFRLLAPQAASRFTLTQWMPALGDNRHARDKSLMDGVICDKSGCTAMWDRDKRVALSLQADAAREDCSRADIVISPLRLPPTCAARFKLDREHFERHGATFITFGADGGARLTGALPQDSHRPWRKAPPTDAQAGLARSPFSQWFAAENWMQRHDGRRFFGLLPPSAHAVQDLRMVRQEEDPALASPREEDSVQDTTANAGEIPAEGGELEELAPAAEVPTPEPLQ